VKEEQNIGTFVFQVHAEDPDPPESGGKLTYAFVTSPNERRLFNITPDTGIVRTLNVSKAAIVLRRESYFFSHSYIYSPTGMVYLQNQIQHKN